MISKETTLSNEEYIKILQEADAEWEAQRTTKDWTFEVLKDPRLRTRPSERERHLVIKDLKAHQMSVLKDRGVRTDAREGYVFDHAEVGKNGFNEFWIKVATDE